MGMVLMKSKNNSRINNMLPDSFIGWLLAIIACSQVILLIVFNFTKMKDTMDYDSICALTQAIEIWNQKTLNLAQWGYQTTLGWDSGVPLAAVIYGMTGDIFASFAITNIIILFFYIFMFNRICDDIGIKKNGKYFTFCLLFIPYSWGQLGYIQMMFTGAAYYNIKAIMAVMLISIMIRFASGKKIRTQRGVCLLFYIFLFLSSCSSSMYELICCVFPVVLYVGVDLLLKDRLYENGRISFKFIKNSSVLYLTGAITVALAGLITCNIMNLPINPPVMKLATAHEFWDNIGRCIMGIFSIFGGVSEDLAIDIVSLSGINYIICFLLLIITLFSGPVLIFFDLLKSHRLQKRCVSIILFVAITNLGVLFLSNMTYGASLYESRYHLLWMMPMLIIPGILLDIISEKCTKSMRLVVYSGIIIALLLINIGRYRQYYRIDNGHEQINQILDDVDKSGSTTLYVIGSENMEISRKMKVFSKKINVVTITDTSTAQADSWGVSKKHFDNSTNSNYVAILANANKIDEIAPYYINHLVNVKDYDEFGLSLYVTNRNSFDLVSGLPETPLSISVDFPYSPGYALSNSEIDENGKLISNGQPGVVLWGPYKSAPKGTYDIEVTYKVKDSNQENAGRFAIETDLGTTLLAEEFLKSSKDKIVLYDFEVTDDIQELEFKLYEEEGTILEFEKYTFIQKK